MTEGTSWGLTQRDYCLLKNKPVAPGASQRAPALTASGAKNMHEFSQDLCLETVLKTTQLLMCFFPL